MSADECTVLEFFRRYETGPHQMLFFTLYNCKMPANRLRTAMRGLIERGLVVKERPEQAYSLTRDGYRLSLTAVVDAD
jgi:predicted transcriptional regulator